MVFWCVRDVVVVVVYIVSYGVSVCLYVCYSESGFKAVW